MGMLLSKLHQLLSSNIDANAARLKCLCFLISAVLQHRTVNLVILSTSDDGKDASNETRYRRLQDFFLNAKLCFQSIGRVRHQWYSKAPARIHSGNGSNELEVRACRHQFSGNQRCCWYGSDPLGLESAAEKDPTWQFQHRATQSLDQPVAENTACQGYLCAHNGS